MYASRPHFLGFKRFDLAQPEKGEVCHIVNKLERLQRYRRMNKRVKDNVFPCFIRMAWRGN